MKPVNIHSNTELSEVLAKQKRSFVLLYKSGSESSECALGNFAKATEDAQSIATYVVDVNTVRDVHTVYGVSSVPTLLEFKDAELSGLTKGCHEAGFFANLLQNAVFVANMPEGKSFKSVTIYSTPGCVHCNNMKSYLRKNNYPYRDVDVSKDIRAAEEMVRRTGQQGVPQTDINGQMIVGFDKKRIDELLGLHAE